MLVDCLFSFFKIYLNLFFIFILEKKKICFCFIFFFLFAYLSRRSKQATYIKCEFLKIKFKIEKKKTKRKINKIKKIIVVLYRRGHLITILSSSTSFSFSSSLKLLFNKEIIILDEKKKLFLFITKHKNKSVFPRFSVFVFMCYGNDFVIVI